MRTSIYVRGQFIAFHRWQDAPKEVVFLANWHRHIFKVRIDLHVSHEDRDLEFFQVKERLDDILREWEGTHQDMSCEMFCSAIFTRLVVQYPLLLRVEVSEDGENGAVYSV